MALPASFCRRRLGYGEDVTRLFSFLRGVFWLAVVVGLLFYLGGGWFFSEQIRSDALEIDPRVPIFDLEVAAVDGASITLNDNATMDANLRSEGTFGIDWRTGYGQVGAILDDTPTSVTRTFTLVSGSPVKPGDKVDVEGFAFPADPSVTLGPTVEDVVYQSPLGGLAAWYLPGADDSWVIHVHGKGASPREALRAARGIAEAGYPQLLITYRNDAGQPQDATGFYQYGRTEWVDLEGAVAYALENGASDVVVFAYSTGGALALSFLYESGRAESAKGLILDAGNIDFGATLDYGASQRDLPLLPYKVPGSLSTVAKFIAEIRFGIDFEELDYVARADELDVPVLAFHGAEDDVVPIGTSRRLAEARPDLVELVEMDGAGHVLSWNTDPAAYEAQVADFLARVAG